MNLRPALPSDCHLAPPSGDGRPPLAEIFASLDALAAAGWQETEIASQPAPSGGALPIRGYASAAAVDAVLIGGIHGREPAGALALARYVPRLIERGRHLGLLVMPLLNPWGTSITRATVPRDRACRTATIFLAGLPRLPVRKPVRSPTSS